MSQCRELSASEMSSVLQERQVTQCTKLLVLGNSGAGKSFFCNVFIGRYVFQSRGRAVSVTTANSYALVEVETGMRRERYIVCNVPGLIEGDERNAERNKAAIEAFRFEERFPTVVLFVTSVVGGRISAEDYTAFKAVLQFVDIPASSVAVVVNRVSAEECGLEAASGESYRSSVRQQIEAILNLRRVQFAQKIPKAQLCDFLCGPMMDLQVELRHTATALKPTMLTPRPGAELLLRSTQLKQEKEDLLRQIVAVSQLQQSRLAATTADAAPNLYMYQRGGCVSKAVLDHNRISDEPERSAEASCCRCC